MSNDDEQLDILIKERITEELQQIPIPPIDEEWLRFKSHVNNGSKRHSITSKFIVAAVAAIFIITGSMLIFRPIQANAFGEHFLQMLSYLVGKTTQNKTVTINNNSSGTQIPQVNDFGILVDKETTLEEAQKSVYFKIAEPKYLPLGTKTVKISITNLSTDVKRITITYDFQGQLIIFAQENTVSTVSKGLLYDTDDTLNKDITINGMPATILQERDGISLLTWYQRGLLLELTGKLSTKELLKIAESIG